LQWELPAAGISGLSVDARIRADGLEPEQAALVEVRIISSGVPAGDTEIHQVLVAGGTAVALEPITAPAGGHLRFLALSSDGVESEASIRILPGILTILPPLFAIVMALVFRQVVIALLAGIWLGALFLNDFNPFAALLRSVDHFTLQPLLESDKVSILLFTLLLGGMIGVISKSGGVLGIVQALARFATNRRRGQIVAWAMGIVIFFDDYSNTLIVGPTMRPVTDRLRISREKLAYIVDTTAASIASIALVSSWIGFEVSLIGDGLASAGIDRDAYGTFLRTILYCFYPWFALVFCFLIGAMNRDFGSMLRAERRARDGQVLSPTAAPLSDFDTAAFAPVPDRPHRWWNAVIPVGVLTTYIFFGLWSSGRAALAAAGDPLGLAGAGEILWSGNLLQHLGTVFGFADSFEVLLQASMIGCLTAFLLAFAQRALTLTQGLQAWINGIKAMIPAFVVLALAWAIGLVCQELQTADYLVGLLSEILRPAWLPTLIFLSSAAISFATGTSWGTMAILVPIVVPLAHQVSGTDLMSPSAADGILFGSIASVLAGAVFGDHCSPISDTTIMSSMASSSDHIDHVRTQLPYALCGGAAAVVLGTLPAGFGLPPWIGLMAGVLAMIGTVRLLGRPVSA
jgi:Na+/H+ antiporter NhaC